MSSRLKSTVIHRFAQACGFKEGIDHAQRHGRPPGWILGGNYYKTLRAVAEACNRQLPQPLSELDNAKILDWLDSKPRPTLAQLTKKVSLRKGS